MLSTNHWQSKGETLCPSAVRCTTTVNKQSTKFLEWDLLRFRYEKVYDSFRDARSRTNCIICIC
jgi:hypothetical protein